MPRKLPILFQHWKKGADWASQGGITPEFQIFFALGGDGSGLGMHAHADAWCVVIHGAKHWRLNNNFVKYTNAHGPGMCQHTTNAPGTQSCVQEGLHSGCLT